MAQEPISQKLGLMSLAALATASGLFAGTPIHEFVGVPSWIAYLFSVPCVAAFSFLFRRIKRDERARVEAVISGRPSLTGEQFSTRFFDGPAIPIATRCHELFSEIYEYDATRVWPDDNLCEDLNFAAHDCLDAAEFLLAIEREFHIRFSQAETADMRTLRDIVQVVKSHTAGERQSHAAD